MRPTVSEALPCSLVKGFFFSRDANKYGYVIQITLFRFTLCVRNRYEYIYEWEAHCLIMVAEI